jgi:hypothetical protein
VHALTWSWACDVNRCERHPSSIGCRVRGALLFSEGGDFRASMTRNTFRSVFGVLGFAQAKRPVFPRNFDEIDEDIFGSNPGRFGKQLRDALE